MLYPIHVLRDAETRVAGMDLARELRQLAPACVNVDLGTSSLRRAVFCLPVLDSVAHAFQTAGVRVHAEGSAAGLLSAHLSCARPVTAAGPALDVDLTATSTAPRLEWRAGRQTLVVPDGPEPPRVQHAFAQAVTGAILAGLPARMEPPRLRLIARLRREARSVLRGLVGRLGAPFVVLAPEASGWAPDSFARLASHLRTSIGARAYVLGARDIPGVLRLPDMDPAVAAALLELAAVCVGDDTDWAHVAAAAGAPTVIVHGPSSPVRTGPASSRGASVFTTRGTCAACTASPGRRCLACLDPQRVAKVAEDLAAQRWPVDRLLQVLP